MKTCILCLCALLTAFSSRATTTIVERFTNNPALDGWLVSGNSSLFTWDSANKALDVTWDSTQPNSYFYHPLGATFSKTNDFLILFDVNMQDMNVGVTPGEPYTFQIALGLINTSEATSGDYYRGYAYFPDIVEFDYFPDDGLGDGPTVYPFMISSQTNYSDAGYTYPLEMQTGTRYHVLMVYTATNQVLHTTMAADGMPFGPIQDAYLDSTFDDFKEDAISITSYNDGGQSPDYAGSILAHGRVSKIAFVSPLPVTVANSIAAGQVQFGSDTNWLYNLQQTTDFQTWSVASPSFTGNGTNLVIQATNMPADKAFYSVRACLP